MAAEAFSSDTTHNRSRRVIAGAGVLLAAVALTSACKTEKGTSASASPTASGSAGGQEVSVGVCSPSKAGHNLVKAGKPIGLDKPASNYGVTLEDRSGRTLRFLTLLTTYGAQKDAVNDGRAVTKVGDNDMNGTTGNWVGGLDDVTLDIGWEGTITDFTATTTVVNANGAASPTSVSWHEGFITSIICAGANSILYEQNGAVQQTTAGIPSAGPQ